MRKQNHQSNEKLRQGISVDQSNDAFIERCSEIHDENDGIIPIRNLTNEDKLETTLNNYNNLYGDFELVNSEEHRNSDIDGNFVVQRIRYSVDKNLIVVCETFNEEIDLNSNMLRENDLETCQSVLIAKNLERIYNDGTMTNLEGNNVDIFRDMNKITLSEEERTEITANACQDSSIDNNLNASVISTSILLDQATSSPSKHEDSIDINEQDEISKQQSTEDQAKIKRKYVLAELVETERDYVKDLGLVVGGYMPALESADVPEDIRTKSRFVFANIQQIYEFHKNIFLKEIEPCMDDYEFVSRAFVKYERRLHMYVVYCQNKPKSEYLVSEFESVFTDIKQKLGHKLNLGDLLIKPVQRIMKYQLLMKDILKYTERAGESTDLLKKAQEVMRVVPKACDDMMHVGRLQGFEGKITAQGKLLHQFGGTVSVSDNPSSQVFKGKDRRIFLFEQSIIIADCILPKKEFAVPQYIYKFHFMVNKLAMNKDVPGENLRIILKSKDPLASPPDAVFQFNDPEQRAQWIAAIMQLLDTQAVFLQALTHPIAYQKALNKEPEYDASSQSSVSSLPKSKLVHQPKSSSGNNCSYVINATSPSKPQRTESYPGSAPLFVNAQRSESEKVAVTTSKNADFDSGKKSEKYLSATSSVSSCPVNNNMNSGVSGNDTARKHSLPESSKHSVKNALTKSKPKSSATCVSLVNECVVGGSSCSRTCSQEDSESSPVTGSPGPCTLGTKSRSKLLDGFKNTLKFFPSKTKNSQ
uniref:DH domain-containing protein n=1 Tax=Romanomermis culicivorax TaxID=13658 RepID=A0A915I1K8_ROMCU